ncbi:hypothetical protein GIB67_000318 [Kingdonia uniflora]|uniref:Uncharacterized protein n=1 Tax=Kingdonia uniflora TaxID=39325 RepID=A0A7J7LCL4_9MAGN|nr:hypothetical protein GIB67_000318 [Kingdonia uniflora]
MLKKAQLQKDAPWRTTNPNDKPIPRINRTPLLTIPQNPNSDYALSLIKHPDPIGGGFASEAKVEAAGPDCIVPGQVTPIKLLGLKVWPININLKFMEPVDRELKNMGKDSEYERVLNKWWFTPCPNEEDLEEEEDPSEDKKLDDVGSCA